MILPQDLLRYGGWDTWICRQGGYNYNLGYSGQWGTGKNNVTEPKNALVKQYKKLFELDGVDLEFMDDALWQFQKKH